MRQLKDFAQSQPFDIDNLEKVVGIMQEAEKRRYEERIAKAARYESQQLWIEFNYAEKLIRDYPEYLKAIESSTAYKLYLVKMEFNAVLEKIIETFISLWDRILKKCKSLE